MYIKYNVKFTLKAGDKGFVDMEEPLISMVFATPIGGYSYKSEINKSVYSI